MKLKYVFKRNLKKYLTNNWSGFGKGLILTGLMWLPACQPPTPAPPRQPVHAYEVLDSVRLGRAELKTLRAEARAELRHGGRKIRFLANLLVAYPDKIFVEASGFGFPASLMAANSKDVSLYIPIKSVAYRDEGGNGVERLLGLNISVQEWVSILLGQLPKEFQSPESVQKQKNRWVVTSVSGSQRSVFTIHGASAWLLSMEQQHSPYLKITYGNPMETVAGKYPSSVRIADKRGHLRLRFEKVIPNPRIPEKHLALDVPPGIAIQPMAGLELLNQKKL